MNVIATPLVLDLDGTLTPVDTLHESLLKLVRQSPASLLRLPGWLSKGKAAFKREVVTRAPTDTGTLPFREDLIEWLKNERTRGRRLVLATASDQQTAEAIATRLDLFDEVISSNGIHNLSGDNKRKALVERYGEKGFDYAGNESVDVAVWKSARRAVVVGDPGLARRAQQVTEVERTFAPNSGGIKAWIKAIRLHQWVKNGLIFLPAVLAHKILQLDVLRDSVMAFIAFGLCASSVYLINDLFDLTSDRNHPRKRQRPFAAGVLSARSGVIAAILLLCSAAALASAVNLKFCAVLAGYYVLTWAYSLRLKRAALVDVMTLAGLYTVRIIAGAAATAIPLSFWLLAFSVLIFLSLGIVKRYTELDDARQAGKTGGHGRGYWAEDLPLLLSLGTASGYSTVVVMALYINSADSQALYQYHKPMWLICPLLLYWISRIWLLTTRGQMHDDPVVFAIRDRISLAVLALLCIIVLVSI